jgi:hypothetical protein
MHTYEFSDGTRFIFAGVVAFSQLTDVTSDGRTGRQMGRVLRTSEQFKVIEANVIH